MSLSARCSAARWIPFTRSSVSLRRWVLVGALGSCTSPAFANAGGAAEQETLTVVLLLLSVTIAYLLAHFFVDALQRRFLILAGAEYLVLGLLLGPVVPEINILGDITGMLPVIALAAGWIGLLRGMELDAQSWRERPPGTGRIVALHHIVPGVAVGGAAYAFFWLSPYDYISAGYWFQSLGVESLTWREVAASAWLLGCCAASDSAIPFDLLKSRYVIEGTLAPRLRSAARFGDVFIIVFFACIFFLFHQDRADAQLRLSATEWGVVQFALGVGLGLLFTPFLGGHESANGRFLAMVGIITFASGAAFFLDLSPLVVNVALGVVLVNVARSGKSIQRTLASTEKPMTLVLLVLAGALWRPPPVMPTLIVLVGFVALRYGGKRLASLLAAWGISSMRRDLYRGFAAQGEITIAMAVSFQIVFDGPVVDLAYTVVLASTVLHDWISPRLLRGLLVDAGELRRERVSSTPLGLEKDSA